MKIFKFDKPVTLEPGWHNTGELMQQKGEWIEMKTDKELLMMAQLEMEKKNEHAD